MSRKGRNTITLFELISKAGGKIKGITLSESKGAPAEPAAADESATQAAAPSAPGPPQPPGPPLPSPAAEKTDETTTSPPPEADTKPVAETAPPAQSPADRPAKAKKKKAARKRTTKATVNVPAKSDQKPKARQKAPPADAAAEKPADKAPQSASLPAGAGEQPAAEPPPTTMPAELARPARLRPKGQTGPHPAGWPPVVSAPSSQFVGLAVAIVLMVATFIVGFLAGRFTAPRRQAQGEQRQVASPLGQDDSAELDGGQPAGTRIEGMHYLIIQELKGNAPQDLQEAWDIKNFCQENDYPADVRPYRKSDNRSVYIVLSLKPFASPGSAEAIAFAEGIEELGRAYEQQGGRYRFQQRRTPTSPLQARFERWAEPSQRETDSTTDGVN